MDQWPYACPTSCIGNLCNKVNNPSQLPEGAPEMLQNFYSKNLIPAKIMYRYPNEDFATSSSPDNFSKSKYFTTRSAMTKNYFSGLHHTAYLDDIEKNRYRSGSISPRFGNTLTYRPRCCYNSIKSTFMTKTNFHNDNNDKKQFFTEDTKDIIVEDIRRMLNTREEKTPEEYKKLLNEQFNFETFLEKTVSTKPKTDSKDVQEFLKNLSEANLFQNVQLDDNVSIQNLDQLSINSDESINQSKISLESSNSKKCKFEIFKPNSKQPENFSLIENIRNKIFAPGKDCNQSDNDDWEEDIKFPKETKNAITMLLNQKKNRCENCRGKMRKTRKIVHTIETQTTPRLSLTNININIYKNSSSTSNLPCPKNLLCIKGVHYGRCKIDSSQKRSKKILESGKSKNSLSGQDGRNFSSKSSFFEN